MPNNPKLVKIDSKILRDLRKKINKILDDVYRELKKNEKNQHAFYHKYLYPESSLACYLQWKVLSNISIKKLILKSNLHKYIVKNISKNYLIFTMIFFRNHIYSNKAIRALKHDFNFHRDDYHGHATNTFWIPLNNITKRTGGLTFLSKNLVSKQDENKFIKIGKYKNYYIYQVKCKVGECFTFDRKLLHNANHPKKNFSRLTIDIRIIDKKKLNLKKFNKNYYNLKGIFRPNKFLDITKIDSELKKFKYQNPKSLLQINY